MIQEENQVEKKKNILIRLFINIFNKANNNKLPLLLTFAIYYLDVLLKKSAGEALFNKSSIYMFLFATCSALIITLIVYLPRNDKAKRILFFSVFSVINLLYVIEFFCYKIYSTYMGLSIILNMGGAVVKSYSDVIFNTVVNSFFVMMLYFIPLILFIIFRKKIINKNSYINLKRVIKLVVIIILVYALALSMILFLPEKGIVGDRDFYLSRYEINQGTKRFGLIEALKLDAIYWIFGTPEAELGSGIWGVAVEDANYGYNTMDIDFDALSATTEDSTLISMNDYFSSLKGTQKNEYTGMFEGKNLIFIGAESLTPWAIDKDLMPTLYKLMNEGFVFKNYYQPYWGVSTSDGEYSLLTGLVPKAGVNSMITGANTNRYFTLGNSFQRIGYNTLAYHNNTYTYYSRHLTHEKLGYDKWIATGSGLDITNQWPRSDLEMVQATVDQYVTNEPFHVYYLSVSGHPAYNFFGNMMAVKNQDKVADLPYSDAIKAYYACNLELEYAVADLLKELEENGVLDNTVIAIANDHYPYGLEEGFEGNSINYIPELVGHDVDIDFELYEGVFMLWNSTMESPVKVDKVCYSLDVLPTLLNLFNLEYDSRLLAGRDILSSAPGLVLFRNYNWITDDGKYISATNTFIPNEGFEGSEEYIKEVSNTVLTLVTNSKYILEKDYYRYLFGDD